MAISKINSNSINTDESTLTLSTSGTERMRVDSSGNLGINTSSPVAKLDVITGPDERLLFTYNSGTSLISSVNAANTAYNELYLNGSDIRFGTSLSERMRINPSGYVTKANQPMWWAKTTNHVTATGTIVFDFEAFDNTGSHNSSTGVYTAPVTGKYLVTFSTLLYNMGSASNVQLRVNGSSYGGASSFGTYGAFTGVYAGQGASAVITAAQNDQITMHFTLAGSTSLHSGYTWWSGYFLG